MALACVPEWCHNGTMNLALYVETLREHLLALAQGDPETGAVVDRIVPGIEAATRMVLLETLSAAADEITRELAPGSVEIRLRGTDPEFAVARFSLYNCLNHQAGKEEEAWAELAIFEKRAEEVNRFNRLRERLERTPRNPDLLVSMAKHYWEKGMSTLSAEFLLRALHASPGHAEANVLWSRMHQERSPTKERKAVAPPL